jgi:hypothetical protein
MASERQIAANRRNAQKSTGPRSLVGKKRAGTNSWRHGLSIDSASISELGSDVDALAHEIAGGKKDAALLQLARAAAAAHLDLVRVRRAKVALINRIAAFGELDAFDPFTSWRHIKQLLNHRYQPNRRGDWFGWDFAIPEPPMLPAQEPERSAEAIRRAVPELLKLCRYERRAASKRDRACKEITARKIAIVPV